VLKDVDSKQLAVAEMENLDSTTMELKKPMKFACFFSGHGLLVGGIPTPLKNMKVKWEGLSHILWQSKIHVPNHQSD